MSDEDSQDEIEMLEKEISKDTKEKKDKEKGAKSLDRIKEKFEGNLPMPDADDELPEEDDSKVDIKKIEKEIREEKGEKSKDDDAEPSTADLYPEASKNEEEIVFALRTTANREDQVMDFVSSNAAKKKLRVYSVIRPHGMRGYIFIEAASRYDAEQAAYNIPYARGILPKVVYYSEIEHMLEQVKREVNIQKNDIVEIISGPFKREKAKITRIDKSKEEVVVELLEAAVPIPITLKLDTVKVIRRDSNTDVEEGI